MITKDDLLHLALLSKLEVKEDEMDALIADMESIVAFADTIAQASGGVEGDGLPTTLENVFREDEVRPSMDRSLILKNVNGGENGCFVVRTRKQAAR